MNTYNLYWSPTNRKIATVEADTPKAAIRKAPPPYCKYKGEIWAHVVNCETNAGRIVLQAAEAALEWKKDSDPEFAWGTFIESCCEACDRSDLVGTANNIVEAIYEHLFHSPVIGKPSTEDVARFIVHGI